MENLWVCEMMDEGLAKWNGEKLAGVSN